jgi:AcrR family transcriptional regulator
MSALTKEPEIDVVPKGRGRPRDEDARSRILRSALEILENTCFESATVDAIAERAGASKATIYRWWSNKAAVFIEAMREAAAIELPFPDTGDVEQDIRLQLQNFVKLLTGRRGRTFRAFIAAAQGDPDVAEAFRTLWIKPRRAQACEAFERHRAAGQLPSSIDIEVLIDMLYGPLYFRLMAGHRPLNQEAAEAIAGLALAAIRGERETSRYQPQSSPIG